MSGSLTGGFEAEWDNHQFVVTFRNESTPWFDLYAVVLDGKYEMGRTSPVKVGGMVFWIVLGDHTILEDSAVRAAWVLIQRAFENGLADRLAIEDFQ